MFRSKPAPPISVADFYAQHKDELLKLISREHLSRTTHQNLKFEIVSQSGKRYYSIPEKMAIPFQRMARGMENMECLMRGASAEDHDRIYNELELAYSHMHAKTLQAGEYLKKSGLLLSELKRRRTAIMPYYVLINLAANYLIREDEDPQVISSQIYHEKCDDLQNEIETGNNAFFLTLPQLKPLSGMQSMSEADLNQYLLELKEIAEADRQNLKAYLSWKEQQPEPAT